METFLIPSNLISSAIAHSLPCSFRYRSRHTRSSKTIGRSLRLDSPQRLHRISSERVCAKHRTMTPTASPHDSNRHMGGSSVRLPTVCLHSFRRLESDSFLGGPNSAPRYSLTHSFLVQGSPELHHSQAQEYPILASISFLHRAPAVSPTQRHPVHYVPTPAFRPLLSSPLLT
jgi:hypothetical protein